MKSARVAVVLSLALSASSGAGETPAAAPASGGLPGDRPTEIFPVGKIVPGLKGYGFSDLGGGKGIQRFDVEMIGTLRRFAPKQDLILARVSGAGLEHSGIIAGMSGSPVYVDGKLVGALAYGWPFSKDPICGITPIQSMLDIRHAPAAAPVPIGGPAARASELVSMFGSRRFSGALDALLAPFRRDDAGGTMATLPIPVSFAGGAGAGPGWLFGRLAEAAGWVAAPAGASGGSQVPSSKFQGAEEKVAPVLPGSSLSTVLLSGDMLLAATGTVTWVEGDSVLAFGHPFLSMGPIDMPMARADVLTVLPSVYRSFKFADSGPVFGSVTQDRSTGILGTVGSRAKMVPITVKISSDEVPIQTYHFEAVHNSMLTPVLAAIAIDSVLTTLEKRAGERTLVWKSSIRTPDRNVRWDTVFSGLAAREDAVTSLALLTNYLMANEFRDLPILGVDVEIAHSDRLQNGRIVNVEPGKERFRAGERVPVRIDVVDFRGGSRRVTLDLDVPRDTPPGPLTVFVGDGNSATAYDLAIYPADPQSLDQVLDFLGRMRPPNSLNLIAYRRAPGAVVAGEALAALPPTVAALLRDRGPGDGTPNLSYLRIQSRSVEQPVPITGSVQLNLEVLPNNW
ncbi:MAG TPA: SpoIVB peptidase S55 domain-containing protein [Thermoanaerobaculia bacterium]|nr:SpoIVB peptidase S55 domain-containing protein [Thermoanaerobaculia bacterium]